MAGAQERAKHQKAMVWWGAMMPRMEKPPSFQEFTGIKPDRAEELRRWMAAWDKVDRALARN
jgi:hypothetical protein